MPNPPTHPDAIGYIQDLVTRNGKAWFAALAERAILAADELPIPEAELAAALQLMRDDVPNPGRTMPAGAAQAATGASAIGVVGWIGEFDNFKRLVPTLRFEPNQRITIVYGRNGSGKSSLCDALRVLALAEEPDRPLANVRTTHPNNPSFKVQMTGEAQPRHWVEGNVAPGILAKSITYYDTSIAIRNIRSPASPDRIVSVAPFRLASFDRLRGYIGQVGLALKKRQSTADDAKKAGFVRLQLATVFPRTAVVDKVALETVIRDAAGAPTAEVLEAKRRMGGELAKACSPDGIKALEAERHALDRAVAAGTKLSTEVAALWAMKPGSAAARLKAVVQERDALVADVVPDEVQTQAFLDFLVAAGHVVDFPSATAATACPMCRQPIQDRGAKLFAAYRTALEGALEIERRKLVEALGKAKRAADAIPAIVPGDLLSAPIDPSLQTSFESAVRALVAHAKADADAVPEAETAMATVVAVVRSLGDAATIKRTALAGAVAGVAEPTKKLAEAQAELRSLERQALLATHLTDIRAVLAALEDEEWSKRASSAMRGVSSQVSTARSGAHAELVLPTFNDSLEREYRALSGKPMSHFGAAVIPQTVNRGEDAEYAMDTMVGPDGAAAKQCVPLASVMSEGEQRMHALALYFAELESSAHEVVVFDDPATSFDYNHIAKYCERLRDFAAAHPGRQIIVLTHCWEFVTAQAAAGILPGNGSIVLGSHGLPANARARASHGSMPFLVVVLM